MVNVCIAKWMMRERSLFIDIVSKTKSPEVTVFALADNEKIIITETITENKPSDLENCFFIIMSPPKRY